MRTRTSQNINSMLTSLTSSRSTTTETKLKEAYAYDIQDGKPTPAKVRQV
jgi:hypothetical protein